MLWNLLNLNGAQTVNEENKDILNDPSTSDEEYEKMDKQLDADIDKLLSRGMKKKKLNKKKKDVNVDTGTDALEEEDEEDNDWTSNELLEMMKNMEFNFDHAKRRSGNSFWFNAFIGIISAIALAYLGQLYIAGQWRPMAACRGDRPAGFCHRCYGPFSGDWIWCVGGG